MQKWKRENLLIILCLIFLFHFAIELNYFPYKLQKFQELAKMALYAKTHKTLDVTM